MFMALLQTTQSKAQRHVFFAERQAAKVADIAADAPTRPIASVGVIGAGTMGGGIAMNFLSAGIPVTIVETSKEALDRGVSIMRRNYENTAKKGRLTMAEVEERMGRLAPTLDFDALADADLVIEAVFENMDMKKSVFERLDAIAKPGAILASNTSYLDIDAIAAKTKRPEDVLGMHFFSPANVMRLLEIVRGAKTSKSVLATIAAARAEDRQGRRRRRRLPRLRRQPHAGPAPARGDEAHSRRRDALGRRPRARRIRPADGPVRDERSRRPRHRLVGRDLEALDDPRNPVRRGPARPEDRRGLLRLRRGAQRQALGACRDDHPRLRQRRRGSRSARSATREILERCIYPMINEGAKILEEGKAQRASDIDIVWINGYGWPVYRGGPMFYADTVGLKAVLAKLKEFQAKFGDDFKPAALLEKLAAEGGAFTKRDAEAPPSSGPSGQPSP